MKRNGMPKIDPNTVIARQGSGYPSPFDAQCAERTRRRLGKNTHAKDEFHSVPNFPGLIKKSNGDDMEVVLTMA